MIVRCAVGAGLRRSAWTYQAGGVCWMTDRGWREDSWAALRRAHRAAAPVIHGEMLTRQILDQDPSALDEVVDTLKEFLQTRSGKPK